MFGIRSISAKKGSTAATFESVYTVPGSYSWVCPPGVFQVSAVCVGAGGYSFGSASGGGGGLGWKNNINVIPGNSYTVVVGNSAGNPNGAGQNSYFIDTSTVMGGGAGSFSSGGNYVGDGGGNGGVNGGGNG